MDSKITYLSEIINALNFYEGEASLKEINEFIKNRDVLPYIHSNPNWTNNVSAEIQRHCSQTKSYTNGQDLFYSVYGLGEGFWGLRDNKTSKIQELQPIIKREVQKIFNNQKLSVSEKEAITKARIGQGVFRQQLLNKYHNKCIITGIDCKELLIASHIKPWRSASNEERLSCENGLLLSPLYDKMFDLGFISFDDNMKIIVSSKLSNENISLINIDCDRVFIESPSQALRENMNYHRNNIFFG